MAKRKPIVGLTGGIGSGKSEVSRILSELGAGVVSSDDINRQLLATTEIKSELVDWWGERILRPNGEIDRAVIADIVFQDSAQRTRLEALMHPRIEQRRAELFAEFQQQPRIRMSVIDAPLLLETGIDRLCDVLIFVDADRSVRIARAAATRGWSAEELDRREKFQWPLDKKRARADYVCQNNSDLATLRQQVEAIFSQIVTRAESDL